MDKKEYYRLRKKYPIVKKVIRVIDCYSAGIAEYDSEKNINSSDVFDEFISFVSTMDINQRRATK